MSFLLSQKMALSTMVLAALFSLSACGEKKEVSPRGVEVQETAKTTKTTVTEGDESVGNDKSKSLADAPTNPSPDSSLPLPPPTAPGGVSLPPPPSSGGDQVAAPAPTATPASEPSVPVPAEPPPPFNPKKSTAKPVPPPAPPIAANPGSSANDPSVPVPAPGSSYPAPPPVSNGTSSGPQAPAPAPAPAPVQGDTGMKEDGLTYTGAGADNLLSYLKERSSDSSAETARQVISARINRSNREISVTLDLAENNSTKTYILSGRNFEAGVVNLQLAQSTGSRSIQGVLKCLDADGGCETSVAKFIINDRGYRSLVRIIFRDAKADVDVALPGVRSGNPEYETLRRYWINTGMKSSSPEKLKEVIYNTFEVVNGRSGFDAQIIFEDHQLIVFAGPLLVAKGSKLDIRADRSADIPNMNQYGDDLANSIGSARIVGNDGRGQVKLSLKMRARGGYKQDAFTLTVMRIAKPILPLNQSTLGI